MIDKYVVSAITTALFLTIIIGVIIIGIVAFVTTLYPSSYDNLIKSCVEDGKKAYECAIFLKKEGISR